MIPELSRADEVENSFRGTEEEHEVQKRNRAIRADSRRSTWSSIRTECEGQQQPNREYYRLCSGQRMRLPLPRDRETAAQRVCGSLRTRRVVAGNFDQTGRGLSSDFSRNACQGHTLEAPSVCRQTRENERDDLQSRRRKGNCRRAD